MGIYKCTWKRTVNSFQDMPVDRSLAQSWQYGFFNVAVLLIVTTIIFLTDTHLYLIEHHRKTFVSLSKGTNHPDQYHADVILTTFKYMILFPSFIHIGTHHHGSCNIKLNTKVGKKRPHLWMKCWLKCNRWFKKYALGAVQLN